MVKKKIKKPKPQRDGKTFDSYEELEFWLWCKEAFNAGFISGVTFHPKTFTLAGPATVFVKKQLKTKTKIEEKTLLQAVTYTADFLINITPQMCKFDHRLFSTDRKTIWIDIKPTYSKFNDLAKFSIIRKWVWEAHGVFVNKVHVETFFEKTWVPMAAANKRNGGRRAKYLHCRNVLQARQLTSYYPMPEMVPAPGKTQDLFESQSNGWDIK